MSLPILRLAPVAVVLSSLASAFSSVALAGADSSYSLLGPSISYHQQRTHAGRAYNETNLGAGIQWKRDVPQHEGWFATASVSVLQDSFNATSIFVESGLYRTLLQRNEWEFSAGLRAGVARKYMRWEGPYRVVGYVGPSVAMTTPWKLELQGLYVYHRNATTGRTNGVFAVQTGWRF